MSTSYYRNSYYLLSNNIATTALGFLFWLVVARYYTANDIGISIALISASGLITNLASFGLWQSVIRYLHKQEDKIGFINTCLTIILVFSIIFSIIFIYGIEIWANRLAFIKSSYVYILLFIVFTALSSINYMLNNIFVAYQNARYSFLQTVILSLLKIPLAITLSYVATILGIFGSWGFAITVAVTISLFTFMKSVQPHYSLYPKIKWTTIKEIFNFSLANYIVGLIGGTPALIFPIIILQVLSADDSAYFYIAFSIASVLFMIPSALSTSLYAEGCVQESTFRMNKKQAIKQAYLMLAPALAIIIFFGDKLLLLFGKSYSINGHFLLTVLAISSLFMVHSSFYITYLKINLRNMEFEALTLISTIGLLLLSYLLLLNKGLIGLGLAYLIYSAALGIYAIIRFGYK
jgi:O-antigen/teichoic acid export membrane protein